MSEEVIIKKDIKDFFKKGEIIFREGDKGNEMYIIKSGKVEIIKKTGKEEVVIATLEPKVFFGEMALFGDPHRSATVRAAEDTGMIVITKEILDSQLKNVPEWFVSILKTLVERLRETNKSIKSRFKISPEFSLLKIIYFIAKREGKELSYKMARDECCNLLSISENEFNEKMKKLMFVGMVKFSEANDVLMIPDEIKLKDFMTFLRNKSSESQQEDDIGVVKGDEKETFEKIYKLLYHKKM